MGDEYRRFGLTSSTAEERERLLAEAFEAGAVGAEEAGEEEEESVGVGAEPRFHARVYAAAVDVEAVHRSVLQHASRTTRIAPIEALPEVDWSEAWKQGLEALRISERLVVRPPFVEWALEPEQCEIVIDPGQAFGTGGHASTRICLDGIDALYASPFAAVGLDRMLDVGTGSGVLALAAARLGAREALGFDLDEVAIEAARQAARANGLADRVCFEAGPIETVAPVGAGWPLVVANLLKREILPIASAVAARVAPRGILLLSGLLDEDAPEVLARFTREGLREAAPRREIVDGSGCWIGLQLARGSERP